MCLQKFNSVAFVYLTILIMNWKQSALTLINRCEIQTDTCLHSHCFLVLVLLSTPGTNIIVDDICIHFPGAIIIFLDHSLDLFLDSIS